MRFVSPEHVAAVQQVLDSSPEVAQLDLPGPVTLLYHLTGAPDGDLDYYMALETGKASVELGTIAKPTLAFEMTYETAVAIAKQKLDATAAFMARKVKVDGPIMKLAPLAMPLSSIDATMRSIPVEY